MLVDGIIDMIHIRQADKDDAESISENERATVVTPGLLVGRKDEIPLSAYINKIQILSNRGRYIVAEREVIVVGHAFLDPMMMAANSHVFQLTIVVHPQYTGGGIGRALLQDLLSWARRDSRVHKIELIVRITNARAIHLYRCLGFIEEGRFHKRVRLPDGDFLDDLAMAWFPEVT